MSSNSVCDHICDKHRTKSHVSVFLKRGGNMQLHVSVMFNMHKKWSGSVVNAAGWESNRPANSCKHIRDAGDSRGDGEYWIDPENKGSPLKVYCDMTTDGGERQMYCGALFSPF